MTDTKSLNLRGKFWTKSLLKPSSTFGYSPKSYDKKPIIDDGYEVTRSSFDWTARDSYNHTHGRIRIESVFGKLLDTPGVGYYKPKIDFETKRETIAPLITMSARPSDHYLENLNDLKQTKSELLKLQNPIEKMKKKKIKAFKIIEGKFSNINIEDMRKSLLPGPGSYSGNYELIQRFDRPPSAKLKPRKPIAIPRKKIILNSLDIIDLPSQTQTSGFYDLSNDPRQIKKSITIGEAFPVPKQREYILAGPGHYNLEKTASIRPGANEILSTTKNLKPKPVDSYQTYVNAMIPSKYSIKKSTIAPP